MKYLKQMLLIAALLLSIGAAAESSSERITVAKQLDGTTVTTGGGTVDVSVSGTTVELTVTPDNGNYFETADLTVMKVINAVLAQARSTEPDAPDYDETVSITADDGNTLTGTSKFTFTLDDDANILYVVTADFHTRTSIATATVTVASGTYTYDGTEHKPGVTVTLGTVTLDGNSDYTISYASNTDAGTAEVTVTGIDKYTSEHKGSFTIQPKALEDDFIADIAALTYTGQEQKPEPTVTYNGMTLAKGTDFTYSYENNVDAGTATLTITAVADGNYSGTASKTFTITQTGGSIRFASATVSKTYGDVPFTNTLTIVGDGTVTYSSDNTKVAIVDADTGEVTIVGAGTATITALISNGANYSYAEKSASFTLTVAVRPFPEEMLIRILPQIYNGQPQEPDLEVVDGDSHILLIKDVDYTVVYSNNVNAGEATVTITGIGNYKGTATATFIIQKATSNLYFENIFVQKTMGDADFVCEPQGAGDGTLTYWSDDESIATVDSATGLVSIKSVGIVKIYAKVSGTDNYEFINDEDWYELEVIAKIATALKPTTATATGVWYTLDGQRLNKKPTRKGVYILNGNKVVIK